MRLEINELSYGFQKDNLLFSRVSFELREGDILTILGVNGVGKTTLARCLLQLVRGYSGTVLMDGKNMKEMSLKERAGNIGYAMLNDLGDCDMQVLDYICLGYTAKLRYFAVPSDRQYAGAVGLMKQYGISHLAGRMISTLSQGEKQMIVTMRVLVQNPQVIVFDEPTAALDLKNQKEMLDLFLKLKAEGKIIIQISHNPNHALYLGGKALLLGEDGVATVGNTENVLTGENLSRLYGVPLKLVCTKESTVVCYDEGVVP